MGTEEIAVLSEMANPQQMEILGDNRIILFDSSNGTVGKMLSMSGNTICGFGKRGKGHGELMSPVNFSVGQDGRSLYFYDYMAMAAQKFQISADSVRFVKTIDFKKNKACHRFNSVCQSTDNSYIGFGYDDKCRILNVADGGVKDNYTSYPHIDDNTECNWSFWSNLANQGVSPDRKHIVTTTGVGMLFEIFDIAEDGKISSKVLKAFYKPVFLLAKGAKPACVIFDNDKTFGGFKTLCLGNSKFWGTIYGKAPDYDAGNEIYEFDYDGNLLKKYKVKGTVVCMAATKDDRLYMILTDSHGENRLVKANL